MVDGRFMSRSSTWCARTDCPQERQAWNTSRFTIELIHTVHVVSQRIKVMQPMAIEARQNDCPHYNLQIPVEVRWDEI